MHRRTFIIAAALVGLSGPAFATPLSPTTAQQKQVRRQIVASAKRTSAYKAAKATGILPIVDISYGFSKWHWANVYIETATAPLKERLFRIYGLNRKKVRVVGQEPWHAPVFAKLL
jgi:hypothetical protein